MSDDERIGDLADKVSKESNNEQQLTSDISLFVVQCQVAMTDLQLSAELIENAIKAGDLDCLQLEMEDVEGIGTKYTDAHVKIMEFCANNPHIDVKNYEDLRRKFLVLLKSTKSKAYKAIPKTSNSTTEKESDFAETLLKLPKVEVTPFSGEKEDWNMFKGTFVTYIHENKKMLDIEKFRFLKSKLKGTPLTLINALPVEGKHYENAWKIIESYYDDPLKRISTHLDALISATPVKKTSLRSLVTHFRAHMSALRITFNERTDIDVLSQFGIHAFLLRADKGARLDWQREMEKTKKFATFEEFITYMDGRCNAYERAVGELEKPSSSSKGQKSNGGLTSKGHSLAISKSKVKKGTCYYCSKESHAIHRCDEFAELSPEDRLTFVNKRRLCRRCLRGRCYGACNIKCSTCERFHNVLIHVDRLVNAKPAIKSTNINGESLLSNLQPSNLSNSEKSSEFVELKTDLSKIVNLFDDNKLSGLVSLSASENIYILLATAIVKVVSTTHELSARALLDPGSQFNFITSKLASRLNVKPFPVEHKIQGIDNLHTSVKRALKVKFKSRVSNFTFQLTCLILDEIIDETPSTYFSINDWDFPNYLSLADPQFNVPGHVDLLLGGGIFWKILKSNSLQKNISTPCVIASHLGWLVAGEIKINSDVVGNYNLSISSAEATLALSKTIEKFWLIEESSNKNDWTFEELECERIYLETTKRNKNGVFNVCLPFKLPKQRLGLSKAMALKRFHALERRLIKDPELQNAYVNNIEDYINQKHMIEVDEENDLVDIAYFLPHHPVIKRTSTSTKTRSVFDASAMPYNGLSLNQCLMVGPTVQSDLISILLRSRLYKYVFTADITQMYRQIKVNEDQQSLLRIFWRKGPSEPLKIYQHTTVPFGLACAPYLATRCLKKLGEDDGDKYPLAKPIILRDFYVDDVITGSNSISQLSQIRDQLNKLLRGGGFHLSKWCSNVPQLLDGIPEENLEKSFPLYFGHEFTVKTLGIIWFTHEDVYKIWVHLDENNVYTKRKILSVISSIFDPLGFLGPVLVIAKLLIQSLWTKRNKLNKVLNWDDDVFEEDKKIWIEFSTQLNELSKISIPRHVFQSESQNRIEIHGFSDASERAYGASIYVRSFDDSGVTTKLLYSKTRVSPLKKSSIPRLELCAAKLLAELMYAVRKTYADIIKIDVIRLWTDSEIVLHWIYSHYSRWQPFVANRVKVIQDLSKDCTWDHVQSKENPADVLSRGLEPSKLKNCKIWWSGPDWLNSNVIYQDEKNCKPSTIQPLEVRQCRNILTCSTFVKKNKFVERFSQFNRLIRVAAWCIRFCFNLHYRGPFITEKYLHYYELEQALYALVTVVQAEQFKNDLKKLQNNECVATDSRLISLSPFLDPMGIIRVGGRLRNAPLEYDNRFQILLPQNHTFSKLLIKYEHERHFHAGPQLLKSILRRKFWILKVGNSIKHIILNCHLCLRQRAETKFQCMADLPKTRVVPGRAFQVTGVDFAGPIKILRFKGDRRRTTISAYIAVFVCFASKAIHLELVTDLTSEAFLAALNRFIGRRGMPKEMWSDNGTNFVGAKNKLDEMAQWLIENKHEINDFLNQRGCNWHFTPPHAPSFGGLWEAGVKSVKKHLKTTFRSSIFTYEQYECSLIQIEACLNSRPLFRESSDPIEPGALTPGHFLIGGPITSLPNPDLTQVPFNRLKYWDLIKRQTQEFWKRWSVEYLNTLQQRTKWKKEKNEIHINDVVIVKEESSLPTRWPLGIITKLHPSSDGVVRVVTVRFRVGNLNDTAGKRVIEMSELQRPINKLVFLPTES